MERVTHIKILLVGDLYEKMRHCNSNIFFVIDVAYQYEPFADRECKNRFLVLHPVTGANLGQGTYSTTAHLIGVSIGFIF